MKDVVLDYLEDLLENAIESRNFIGDMRYVGQNPGQSRARPSGSNLINIRQ